MENFGGPVWHASGRGRTLTESKRIAHDVIRGVGDAALGQWEGVQGRPDIWHVQRRLTDAERAAFAVPAPLDIRGTDEARTRIASVLREAPYVLGALA